VKVVSGDHRAAAVQHLLHSLSALGISSTHFRPIVRGEVVSRSVGLIFLKQLKELRAGSRYDFG
jgi:hypothetical protein